MVRKEYLEKIDEEILETLREITQENECDLIGISYDSFRVLDKALYCRFEGVREGYLLHCTIILARERIANRKEIQQLKDEAETLKKELHNQEEIISAYNGLYRQKAKVKSGMKIAKKNGITKEAIQQLKDQKLTIEQIANKLGCSRTTVWRRLKE